jgi:hypothetical protein
VPRGETKITRRPPASCGSEPGALAPSFETTDVSDPGPRLLAITTGRPARRAVRAIGWPSRPAPMIPTGSPATAFIRFLPRIRRRTGS